MELILEIITYNIFQKGTEIWVSSFGERIAICKYVYYVVMKYIGIMI